jgi:hypothetical protein
MSFKNFIRIEGLMKGLVAILFWLAVGCARIGYCDKGCGMECGTDCTVV